MKKFNEAVLILWAAFNDHREEARALVIADGILTGVVLAVGVVIGILIS